MIKDYLSIVIPCKNEENYIKRTLEEVSLQSGIRGTRVIIADGGSTDLTIQRISEFINSEDNNLVVEIIKGGGVSFGRNRGAELVKTPFILFLDADITFTDLSAIDDSLNKIRNGNIELIGTTPEYMGDFDLAAGIIFFLNRVTAKILSVTDPFAVGAFMLISRKRFIDIGGFDEEVHQSEDWLLSRQISPKKFKLIPNLITQDNRRFKKFGYLRMLKMVIANWFNRGDKKHFHKDLKYWE